ncbi:hypothetical protein Ocin01_19173 [Orchesella cincta]|uniref:Uncharacterized protein n=1 Tax=Orchesella cincta TaxID=48709 RepID=A0A1D2M3G9_ORCCI|nr:hypothetical protein Ocin01_19173 [Orchesella cincta]
MDTCDTTMQERDGIAEIRSLLNEFLKSGEGSEKVREYISSVTQDDTLIRIYLKGRKYRANYAWETLKRNAEVRFDKYPEVFPTEPIDVIGQLKNVEISCILPNLEKWDPDEISSEQMTIMGLYLLERGLRDDDMMTNASSSFTVALEWDSNMRSYTHYIKR